MCCWSRARHAPKLPSSASSATPLLTLATSISHLRNFIAEYLGIPLVKPYMGIKNGELGDWSVDEGVNFAVIGATALEGRFFEEKAQHMGIPLLKPYLGIKKGKIQDWNPLEGVNFAFAGATALDRSFFIEKGVYNVPTNYSLRIQLDWFMDLLPSICNSSSGCKEVLGSSLFLVGEIGGNDFNYPRKMDKSVEEIRNYVPHVIDEISSAINKLISLGAQTLVVPGNLPIGCIYIYLTMYQSTNTDDYDHAGCLKWLNKFAQYYNKQLNAELNRLKVLHPHTNIIYADYYNAALPIYQFPRQFGFKEQIQNACCPSGDQKGYKGSEHCGKAGVTACDDPSKYISWDGMHLTEAAYKWIAQGLLQGPFMDISISSCDSEM